jgi:hypothetical protein
MENGKTGNKSITTNQWTTLTNNVSFGGVSAKSVNNVTGARQVGWDSQQSDFNYQGGQVIGLAMIILIPMGGEYAKTVSATAGLRSAAGLLDDAIGGVGKSGATEGKSKIIFS